MIHVHILPTQTKYFRTEYTQKVIMQIEIIVTLRYLVLECIFVYLLLLNISKSSGVFYM